MSAEWFWLTLLHSPLPLTEGSHNSQCCRNIILSFSSSLPFSPLRVYSAIVSRTGDQSANSHMNADVRLAAGRGRLLVSNNHRRSEKMGEQTEATERQLRTSD